MDIQITDKNLSHYEQSEIAKLLDMQCPDIDDDLEQIWYLMDLVWDELGCDSRKLDWQRIGSFYAHSVWLLNGLFIEQHPLSMEHREAIARWIVDRKLHRVVDYGGGFGTLARTIAQKNSSITVEIFEPHPSAFGLKRAAEFDNIVMIDQLAQEYDCLVSTDVLEHVPDPLADFATMVESVKVGGCLVIANCFYPVIKCHLPQTFHLRYSFDRFAALMGLEIVGRLKGSHATIYRKIKSVKCNWIIIRVFEKISQLNYLVLLHSLPVLRRIKKWIVG